MKSVLSTFLGILFRANSWPTIFRQQFNGRLNAESQSPRSRQYETFVHFKCDQISRRISWRGDLLGVDFDSPRVVKFGMLSNRIPPAFRLFAPARGQATPTTANWRIFQAPIDASLCVSSLEHKLVLCCSFPYASRTRLRIPGRIKTQRDPYFPALCP